MQTSDFVILGAGMAGASVASELAAHGSVTLLEMEKQAGLHATGRSAALFTETYGNAVIQRLTRASRSFLESPPAGFTEGPLLSRRGALYIAAGAERAEFDAMLAAPQSATHMHAIDIAEACTRVPILRRDRWALAALEAGAMDLDVAALHQGFLRHFRQRGGELVLDVQRTAIAREHGVWRVRSHSGEHAAPVLINAAGAWADDVAATAGVPRLGIEPKRRTAVLVDSPPGLDCSGWPMVIDIGETFYFKPESGRLLVSPADETPMAACDVAPDDLDVAVAVDRFEQATTHTVQKVSRSWAGLRTFAPDRTPVVGFDPLAPGFFWLAGQGGYGIQTAPALARTAAALALRTALAPDLLAAGVRPEALSAERLRRKP